MGGYNSSRWNSHSCRPSFGSIALALNGTKLVELLRAGRGTLASVEWPNGANIRVQMDGEPGAHRHLRLDYSLRLANGPWRAVTESIAAVPVAQPFGGVRWWLLCPTCWERRATLYHLGWGSNFRCRECHRLAYPSQRQDRTGRLQSRILKLERRMTRNPSREWSDPSPRRPKGMHRRRYDRHYWQWLGLYEHYNLQMLTDMKRLLGPF